MSRRLDPERCQSLQMATHSYVIRAQPDSRAISLGPRILRAETAALAALSCWMATAGDCLHPDGAEIVCVYTSTGTAPTAGAAEVYVEFLVDNTDG